LILAVVIFQCFIEQQHYAEPLQVVIIRAAMLMMMDMIVISVIVNSVVMMCSPSFLLEPVLFY